MEFGHLRPLFLDPWRRCALQLFNKVGHIDRSSEATKNMDVIRHAAAPTRKDKACPSTPQNRRVRISSSPSLAYSRSILARSKSVARNGPVAAASILRRPYRVGTRPR